MEEKTNGFTDVEILQGLGYASIEQGDTLMGTLSAMPKDRRKAAFAQIQKTSFGSANKSVRDLVIERMSLLPTPIANGLAQKSLQIVETELVSVKYITNKGDLKFFEDADKIKSGETNVNGGMLKKDEWFLLCAIQYQEGVGASSTDATTAIFGAAFANGSNGDFDLQANNNKYLLPERSPLGMFSDISAQGGWKNKANTVGLDNPKWIEPGVKFGVTARYGTANATANLHARFKLIGASIISL